MMIKIKIAVKYGINLQFFFFFFPPTENALKALSPASTKQAVERAVGVCKKVVSAFSNSWKRKRDLAKAQAALGLPQHQLITESPTRWGSRQQMIARFLEQEKAVSQVLLADKKVRHGQWTLHIDFFHCGF